MQPFHCDLHPQIPKPLNYTHRQTHPKQLEATVTVWEPKNVPATASRRSCATSPAAATLPEKTQCFALRLPPHSKPHATVMQPWQCVLQHHVANSHLSTHEATKHNNNHAAIPLRSATIPKQSIRTRTQTHPKHPQPPHTRGALHRQLQPLEKRQCFALRFSSQSKPHATC